MSQFILKASPAATNWLTSQTSNTTRVLYRLPTNNTPFFFFFLGSVASDSSVLRSGFGLEGETCSILLGDFNETAGETSSRSPPSEAFDTLQRRTRRYSPASLKRQSQHNSSRASASGQTVSVWNSRTEITRAFHLTSAVVSVRKQLPRWEYSCHLYHGGPLWPERVRNV